VKENVSQIRFIKEAFQFEFNQRDHGRYKNDRYPISIIEKILSVAETFLSKKKLKELIQMYSSCNYGVHLLNSVFPKIENPDGFHSQNGEVYLNEHPVQVMGWKKYDELIEEGVKSGLNKDYIIFGFEMQAENRGIDLEWHFFEEVPHRNDSNVTTLLQDSN